MNLLSWLVVRVFPQKEFEAEKRIKDCGYDALCPYEEKWRRKSSRSRHKQLWKYPLYTRYVFAQTPNWPADWFQIKDKVDVVLGPIGFLKPADVSFILRRDDGSGSSIELHRAIKLGSEAKVADGAFRGHVVTVDSIAGSSASVVMQLFNSKQIIKIPLANLDPL